jgi:glyoxylase-like metal-dependent hydrolase (beta-lactamase superfamily II)
MIEIEEHGDVIRLILSSRRSRLIGYSVSAYLTRGTLVDAGPPNVWRELLDVLRAHRPRGALITHHHEDHAGNIALLAKVGLPIAASPATLAAAESPQRIAFYRRFTWGSAPPLRRGVVPFDPDGLALLAAPGHSDDHHVAWDAETGTLFSGDLFLGVKVRVAHETEDLRRLARTLRDVAALAPRRMFDAHRGLVADPISALMAKADWLDETIAAIDRRIAEGWDDRAIRDDVLGGEDWSGRFSRGAYSRLSFVRSVRRTA